jgi:hypothetical protein
MKLAVGNWRLAVALRIGVLCCLLPITCTQLSCSLPNLEDPTCSEARTAVKHIYSFHFGGEMKTTAAGLKAQEQYMTPELYQQLSAAGDSAVDYFTGTDDYPKAFRAGSCTKVSDDHTIFQIVLLWRDDNRSMQKEVKAEAVKLGGKWLISKVSN